MSLGGSRFPPSTVALLGLMPSAVLNELLRPGSPSPRAVSHAPSWEWRVEVGEVTADLVGLLQV